MRKFLILFLLLWTCAFAQSQTITQQLISSSGDEFKNNTYQLDWSVGETTTETLTANNLMLTQGFHQGHYIITSIEQMSDLQFDINVFPNPTTDFIQLKIQTEKFENLHFTISDLSGKILFTEKQIIENQQIILSNYLTGVYFLSVYKQNQLLKSFKIIKTN